MFLSAIGFPEKSAYRLIADAESVAELPRAVIQVAESKGIDLAKQKHRPAVKAIQDHLQDEPEPDEKQAEQLLDRILPFRVVPPPPRPLPSLEEFAARTERSFEIQFRGVTPAVRNASIQYVFEAVNAKLRSSVRHLRQFDRPGLVPKPAIRRQSIA